MKIWSISNHSLPPHCRPQNEILEYISSAFDTCIPSNLALLSTTLGTASIIAWLFAQLPQIYKNYQLKSTAGLSIWFLVEWCLGDTANLVGAILLNQAAWQIIIAGYYTFVDVTLVIQYFYFTRNRKQVDGNVSQPEVPTRPGTSTPPVISGATARPIKQVRNASLNESRIPSSMSPLTLEKKMPESSRTTRQPTTSTSIAAPKTVLMLSMVLAVLSRAQASPLPAELDSPISSKSSRETVGQFASWISTALYLGSRIPQLHKNWRRKSTSGLSINLFVAAFFGNLFYSTSLIANPLAWKSYGPYGHYGWVGPEGSDRLAWIQLAIPFFLGAAGVLLLDAAMALQFYVYGEGQQGPKLLPVVDEAGQKHWERVNGWMRGFIPSPRLSPQRLGTESDRQSLLGTSPRSYGGVQNR